MLRNVFTLVIALCTWYAHADVFVYSGVYQGKDLYVTNPFASDGVGFCVFEVHVNGEITTDEWNSSAFAVDLSMYGFKEGSPVEVVIRTKDACAPRIINPEAIAPRSTFEVTGMEGNGTVLSFTTTGEEAAMPFVIEQYKWNKWVAVATIDGKGKAATKQHYAASVPLHSGANTFRVAQADARTVRRSAKFEVTSTIAKVALESDKITDLLMFSAETDYEVFDAFGRLVAKGYDRTINTSNWKSGVYYVNFDRTFGHTVTKR